LTSEEKFAIASRYRYSGIREDQSSRYGIFLASPAREGKQAAFGHVVAAG
jgi:hypothetical protein